jgi:hypothetical protein
MLTYPSPSLHPNGFDLVLHVGYLLPRQFSSLCFRFNRQSVPAVSSFRFKGVVLLVNSLYSDAIDAAKLCVRWIESRISEMTFDSRTFWCNKIRARHKLIEDYEWHTLALEFITYIYQIDIIVSRLKGLKRDYSKQDYQSYKLPIRPYM